VALLVPLEDQVVVVVTVAVLEVLVLLVKVTLALLVMRSVIQAMWTMPVAVEVLEVRLAALPLLAVLVWHPTLLDKQLRILVVLPPTTVTGSVLLILDMEVLTVTATPEVLGVQAL
jgi:hypothetical protein